MYVEFYVVGSLFVGVDFVGYVYGLFLGQVFGGFEYVFGYVVFEYGVLYEV